VSFYSSFGDLNVINKLRPVAFNFGKYLDVSSKIVKGNCTDVPDTGLLLLDDAITDSFRFLLT
jgi:hypothetical protein